MGSEREITGKIFIITGAASGLGAACTEAFLKEGAKHIAILDVAEDNGKELEQRLNKAYGPARARYMQCDVSNDEQFADAFKKVLEEYGRIDVLINNAGILDEKRHQKLIEINLMAVVAGSYRALDMMRCERGGSGGTIINISSVAGLRTIHITPTYCATKSAVLAFSQCLGMPEQYNRTKVRVLAICYGCTDTDIMKDVPGRTYDQETAAEAQQMTFNLQSLESAVEAMVTMFKRGESGSAWLSMLNLPAKDITDYLDEGRRIFVGNYGATK